MGTFNKSSDSRSRVYLLCGALLINAPVFGASLNQSISTNNEANKAAVASQTRIDTVSQQTDKLFNEYKVVTKQIDGLRVYNKQLEKQIANQLKEMESIRDSIDQVTVIERQIVPLMMRMIDGLKQFVDLDIPFLMEERQERLANLERIMDRADVSVAEKFRKVLEAYQIENDYGRTIEAYRGNLDIDGNAREVEFLRVGRIGLMYQTDDANHTGIWDQQQKQWTPLSDKYKTPIKQGLRVARKEVAPDLLKLPVPAPETAQ